MDNDFQEFHRPIDERIVQLLLSLIPEGWWSIKLDIIRDDQTAGENGLSLSISSDEGYKEIVMPTNEMYQAVAEHLELFVSLGKPWRKLGYRVFFDEEIENWRFTIDYDY
ncbi:hypothetical protein [Gimesia maris]|uniref:hypothetical protein n=1 Tax=Gimesia maris TaxID=122 RepID=UPI002420304F|nr:hypothetical protein [Gimesia maris]|tara:strand:- start:2206 stop:2535 length:330 start_codon:yes stop_codon:yes gene_type:complete